MKLITKRGLKKKGVVFGSQLECSVYGEMTCGGQGVNTRQTSGLKAFAVPHSRIS